ncbi:MAG TPA: hypothetical protein PK765_03300 [bacterium]|nr:hypothetical protein [bacterium]
MAEDLRSRDLLRQAPVAHVTDPLQVVPAPRTQLPAAQQKVEPKEEAKKAEEEAKKKVGTKEDPKKAEEEAKKKVGTKEDPKKAEEEAKKKVEVVKESYADKFKSTEEST